jgi:large subunit ribosomal protein L9
MKIIFIKDVKGQGKKDDIKDVKDGYAKYLISSNSAVPYTEKSVSVLNKQIDKRKEEEKELVDSLNKIKNKLENKKIEFKVKTGNNDKVFGSISTKQISDELSKLGFDIDKKKIECDSELNTLGTHVIKINLHKEVIFNINVILVK